MDHNKIKDKIDKLPICKDGKKAVTELLEEFGYKPEKDLDFEVGDIFSNIYGDIRLVIAQRFNGDYILMGYQNNPSLEWNVPSIKTKESVLKYLKNESFTRKIGKIQFHV